MIYIYIFRQYYILLYLSSNSGMLQENYSYEESLRSDVILIYLVQGLCFATSLCPALSHKSRLFTQPDLVYTWCADNKLRFSSE